MKLNPGGLLTIALWLAQIVPGQAYDITDKFSIGGVISGAYQYQWLGDDAGGAVDNQGRGAFNFEPEFSFRPKKNNEIFVKIGFGAGNGLNTVTGFTLTPWVANLQNDYKAINGRNRDYLLTAWYKYTFDFGGNNTLNLTGGIIDATDYVDENRYTNNEFTQFMNEGLVNGPIGFATSYDVGVAVEWEMGNFDITGVGMNIGKNEDGNNYNYFAGQFGYRLNTSLGEGSYRFMVAATSMQFLNEKGDKKRRLAGFLSIDQELGDMYGAWIRFGWQDDKAIINYDTLFSGGLNITGKWYGSEDDNIGIGYAYMHGKNDLDCTRVVEVYWRKILYEYFALTADFQYMKDTYLNSEKDIDGFITGIRMTVEF